MQLLSIENINKHVFLSTISCLQKKEIFFILWEKLNYAAARETLEEPDCFSSGSLIE